MSDTQNSPAPKPVFHYVVVSPFLTFAKGDVISAAAAIAVIEAEYLPHVVRVTAP